MVRGGCIWLVAPHSQPGMGDPTSATDDMGVTGRELPMRYLIHDHDTKFHRRV